MSETNTVETLTVVPGSEGTTTISGTFKVPPSLRPSSALPIMKAALAQVDEVLVKANQTLQMLQQQLSQVSSQQIGLSHQKQMLVELIKKIHETDTAP